MRGWEAPPGEPGRRLPNNAHFRFEGIDHGRPDAGGGPGDERNAVGEFSHFASLTTESTENAEAAQGKRLISRKLAQQQVFSTIALDFLPGQ